MARSPRWRNKLGTREAAPKYHSRDCWKCGRDYLYPQYGGWAVCNSCKIGQKLGDREWLSELLRDDPSVKRPPISPAEWHAPQRIRGGEIWHE